LNIYKYVYFSVFEVKRNGRINIFVLDFVCD